MVGYVTIGTNNLPRAAKFYDELLGVIGARRFMESERFVAWQVSDRSPGIGVTLPFDGKPATVGNGMMVALVVDSRGKVQAIYDKALALGGKDEGLPGQRMEGFYAAYFRDLDGNKLNAFYAGP